MWTRTQEVSSDPLWDVRLEVLKDYMYVHKGQILEETVQAPDKSAAQLQALKNNEMNPTHIDNEFVRVIGIKQWTDNGSL